MLKDFMLQFFLSVLPVFAFLLWHDKAQSWKSFRPFISISCGAAMILCFLTPIDLHDFNFDFRIVPLLIGSLYGGFRAYIGLSLIYVAFRLPTLDNQLETIIFALYILFFSVMVLVAINSFQSASPGKKVRIAMSIMTLQIIYLLLVISVYLYRYDVVWTWQLRAYYLIATVGFLLSIWLSIYIVEGIKEKRLLQFKVTQLTENYRNEVEKLQQFIDKAPIGVMMLDRDGIITHVNEESLRMLSLRQEFNTIEQLKDNSFTAVFHPDDGEACLKLLHRALMGQSSSTVPNRADEQILIYTTVTLRDVTDDFISGAALITKDVTELTVLRNEVGRMERLSLVGQMAASITHEIRNPMAVVRGFVQLIQERSPGEQFEYFRIIMEELDRANLIISDFLSLAQNRELRMTKASLHTSINDLIPLLTADANLRGQTLEVSLCKDMPLMMLNDREIKQLLLNISRNGMEAMGEKGVLRIKTESNGEQVWLTISDEGVGIPQEKMKHLFEPFFTTKTSGTGLGLPLCLSIAERHRGRIDVHSTEGCGTTFLVTFNIAENDVGYSSA
ncbi:ATP-binding protein [Paenibacillus sp. HB172176]|uniref:ATP-binding protein n=1 Tax=Paenibacillus sp. HB172176 TaxID=2493690 RepID=UPI00143B1CD2|nr:ATP-binding protein [Paenibacillus sp. HB172176]